MRKSEFRGWKEVFRFTLIETWKNRSFLIFMILMWVVCFLTVPVLSLLTGGNKDKKEEEYNFEKTSISKVYVLDELMFTSAGFDVEVFKQKDVFKDIPVVRIPFILSTDAADAEEMVKAGEEIYKTYCKKIDGEPNSVMIHICADLTSGVTFDIVRAIESKVEEKECDYIGKLLTEEFAKFKYVVAGVGDEQLRAMDSSYEVVALMETSDGQFVAEKAHLSSAKYWVVYAILFAVMMICIMSSSQVATAVAMDKSTRVMEYLLTSVRPMALVFGKVVAQVASTVFQLGISFALALLSNVLTRQFTGNDYLKAKLPQGVFDSITIPNVLIALLAIGGVVTAIGGEYAAGIGGGSGDGRGGNGGELTINGGEIIAIGGGHGAMAIGGGVMLYGFIAGLCGAMVRKMEEMQESMTVLSILSIVGAYLAMFAAISMQRSITNPLYYVAMLVPISSPFLLPGVCLIGVGAWWLKLTSLAILIVVDLVILVTSARVYEILILYNGSKIKFKDLFRFLKQAKGGKTV